METVARGSRRCGFGQRNWLDLSLLSGSPDDAQRLRMRPHTRHKPVLFFFMRVGRHSKKKSCAFFFNKPARPSTPLARGAGPFCRYKRKKKRPDRRRRAQHAHTQSLLVFSARSWSCVPIAANGTNGRCRMGQCIRACAQGHEVFLGIFPLQKAGE
ncbi:hypothetical protein [Pandoravirus japonicus]|uniref:Uncharacterized protein n=1 Tax=Pandoravirus japonicus TaxID=2823154 RepID=A0A811BQP9_9VIRU|nr:hypothetical protein [Pandoravirus japonicus]